jgi:hypothetical protein
MAGKNPKIKPQLEPSPQGDPGSSPLSVISVRLLSDVTRLSDLLKPHLDGIVSVFAFIGASLEHDLKSVERTWNVSIEGHASTRREFLRHYQEHKYRQSIPADGPTAKSRNFPEGAIVVAPSDYLLRKALTTLTNTTTRDEEDLESTCFLISVLTTVSVALSRLFENKWDPPKSFALASDLWIANPGVHTNFGLAVHYQVSEIKKGGLSSELGIFMPLGQILGAIENYAQYTNFLDRQNLRYPWKESEKIVGTIVDLLDKYGESIRRKDIKDQPTDENGAVADDDPRWATLNNYFLDSSEPISEVVRRLFPELRSSHAGNSIALPQLPSEAPERWPGESSKRTESPVEFATRVYRPWMDAGLLTRQDLKRLDPTLFASLDNWEKNNRRKPNPNPYPEGFRLLTIEQANDAWIERVRAGEEQIPVDPEELARFANALQYRALESSKPLPSAPPLPKRAPERWPTNPAKRTENPAEFATRVYRPWMDAGMLARTDIKRLDLNLYAALNSWLVNNPRRKEPEPMPEGFRLLTKSESNDLWASKVREGQTGIADAGQAARLASLLHRRGRSRD